MKSIILYGSRYGSARRYAQELSSKTGIPAVGYRDIPSLSGHQTIVYIGRAVCRWCFGAGQDIAQSVLAGRARGW